MDANLFQISLHHLRHAFCIGIIGALHRHPPQIGLQIFDASFFKRSFSRCWIIGNVFCVFVIRPHGWWNGVHGLLASAMINFFENGSPVNGHSNGGTDLYLVKWRLLRVHRQITDVKARLLNEINAAVRHHRRNVGRVRRNHHLAFACFHLGISR